ncbi:hypothetical protein KEM56_001330 [Ascosphaera pollenicola]|nr:hypothetical protein KEM56_001330 [Ascosphaera pollenicola]
MERLKATAAEYAKHVQEDDTFDLQISTVSPDTGLTELWQYLSQQGSQAETDHKVLEKLIVLNVYLNSRPQLELDGDDETLIWDAICQWTSDHIVPDERFAKTWTEIKLEKDASKQRDMLLQHRSSRLRYSAGIHALRRLNGKYSIANTNHRVQIIATILAYASWPNDDTAPVEIPWTSSLSSKCSKLLLSEIEQVWQGQTADFGQSIILGIANGVIKPAFARNRSDAITSEGRKREFPIRRARFDSSLFSEDTSLWKKEAIWVVSVLEWVSRWYDSQPLNVLEGDLPLLIPAVLSLLDDSTLTFKAKGCEILSILLACIGKTKSDFLRKTNLDDVFADALRPCLLWLPKLHEEHESVYLLSRAFPALFKLIEVRYHKIPRTKPDEVKRATLLGRILRSEIIQSYHHVSTLDPSEGSTMSSFPYPTLSALLLEQLQPMIRMMQSETIPFLQDLISMMIPTLSNPFIMADLRLAGAALEALRTLILNAWPRMYSWRGDVCAGLTDAWIRLSEDYPDLKAMDPAKLKDVEDIRTNLRETLAITRIAAQECVDVAGQPEESQTEFNRDDKEADFEEAEKKKTGGEAFDTALRNMIAADDRLEGLIGWVLKEGETDD